MLKIGKNQESYVIRTVLWRVTRSPGQAPTFIRPRSYKRGHMPEIAKEATYGRLIRDPSLITRTVRSAVETAHVSGSELYSPVNFCRINRTLVTDYSAVPRVG